MGTGMQCGAARTAVPVPMCANQVLSINNEGIIVRG